MGFPESTRSNALTTSSSFRRLLLVGIGAVGLCLSAILAIRSFSNGSDKSEPASSSPPIATPAQKETGRMLSSALETAPGKWLVPRSAKESITAQKSAVITLMKLEPTLLGDRIGAFCIAELQPGSAFERVGFRKGDLIREINGTPLDTLKRALGLYEELLPRDRIEVRAEREGKSLEFSFEFR